MTASIPTFVEARRIAGLALPLALVQLAQVAISTTDIIMLGWLGGEAVAAGALGFFCFNLLRTIGFGLIVGTSNLIAADRGEIIDGAHLVAGLVIATVAAILAGALAVGAGHALPWLGQDANVAGTAAHYLLLIAPGYLPLFWFYAYRGVVVGRRRSGALLAITLATILVNAVLDYAFIYGVFGLPRLGAAGVALASTVAYLLQFLAIAVITHRMVSFTAPHAVAKSIRRLLKTGVPTAASYGSEAGFSVALTLMIGAFGAAALAGHAVVNQISYIVFMLSVGLSHATSVSVSEAVGAKSAEASLRAGRTGFLIVGVTMAFFSIMWLTIPNLVLGWFSLSDPNDAATIVAIALLPVAATSLIIGEIRIPRVVTGILAGIHFAVAGLLLQTITRNPLADPSIMGVSQGATLAVTIFLFLTVYVFSNDAHFLHKLPVQWLPLVGCIGGSLAGALVHFLAFRHGLNPMRITLCGIAVGAVLHAAAMGIIAGWGTSRLEIVMQWLSGSLYARSWEHVQFLLPFTVVGVLSLPLIRRSVDMLRFEEDVARSFGLSYRREFSLVLLLACALAASAVGTVGPLIFVGLVVPHLARYLAGPRFGLVLPMTILLGAGLVTFGDLVGRLVGGPGEIPIGVVTAIGGAPVLLALLRRTS